MNATFRRYAISDRNLALATGCLPPPGQAAHLGGEGVDFFQLREKDLSGGALAALAREVLAALSGTPTRVLINGRADVAIAVGAHGVHLTSSPAEMTPEQVHRLFAAAGRPAPLITTSCHSLADVTCLAGQALTAILFGPVFGKSVAGATVAQPLGLAALAGACRLAGAVPVLALGGVTADHIGACLDAGAAGVAGIRLFQRPARPSGL